MKKLLLFLLLIPALVSAQVTATTGFFGKVPTVIYWPSKYDAHKKYPVVLFLHGQGEMGDGTDKSLKEKLVSNGNHAALLAAAEKYQFIVIAPQLVQSLNNWIPGWTNEYLMPIYNYILKDSSTDLSHIIVTGLSLGGGGTWVVITGPFARFVSAAIPICGTPQYDEDYSQVGKYHIPVWAWHAKDDKTINYVATQNIIGSIEKYNPMPAPNVTYLSTGGHGIWGKVYATDEIYSWALTQLNDYTAGEVPAAPAPPADPVIATYKIIVYQSGKVETVKQ